MKMFWITTLACAALAMPASAAEAVSACTRDPNAKGMHQRMDNLRQQMDRIEWTTDHAEKRQLLELHAKLMREGLREMRVRKVHPHCQLEIMGTVMESMARHELVMHEDRGR